MKFNILEKKALLSVLMMLFLFVSSIFYIGQRNLWFEKKVIFKTKVKDADALREGAVVTLSGLRVGDVTDLKVGEDNKIEVTFSVKSSLAKRITDTTIAKLHRTFLIGEKRIDLIIDGEGEKIKAGSYVTGLDSTEITDFLSGKSLDSIFSRLSQLQSGLDNWAKSFNALSKSLKPEEIVEIYKLVAPTLRNVNSLAKDIREDLFKNNLAKSAITNLEQTLSPLAKRQKLIENTLNSVTILTNELVKYPDFAKDLIEVLKETSTTLKAIQKTWMLRDHVEEVKKEE